MEVVRDARAPDSAPFCGVTGSCHGLVSLAGEVTSVLTASLAGEVTSVLMVSLAGEVTSVLMVGLAGEVTSVLTARSAESMAILMVQLQVRG